MADKKTLELQIKLIAEQASAQIRQLSGEFRNIATDAQNVSRNIRENGTTFSNLKNAAEQAATSFRLFGENSSELRSLQQQLKKSALELVEQGLEPESEEVQNLVNQYRELGEQAEQMERKEGGLLSMFNDIKSEIGSLAIAAAAVKLDKFVVDMGSYALQQADALDTVRNNFGIMLNDMQAGAALADKVNSFNVNTPFNLDQVSQATQVLYTAKVSLTDMEEYLTRFGDLAQGNAGKFQSFTKAYQKAAAKGKADMEVLNIYLEQGIPILDTLAANMGTTSDQIMDMASKGKVSFSDLTNAIKTMTDEGGGYFGTMAKASESWESVQAGLHESLNSLAASLGEMLMPAMKAIVSIITGIVDTINNSPFLKGVLMAALSALVVFINGKMIVAVVALIAKLWAQYAAQMSVNAAMGAANPVILAATVAVAGLTAGYVAYSAAMQKSKSTQNEQALATRQQEEAVVSLSQALDQYRQKLMDVTMAEVRRRKRLAELDYNSIDPDKAELEAKLRQSDLDFVERTAIMDRLAGLEEKRNRIREQVAIYDSVLQERQMSIVEPLYKNTKQGKIEGLNSQISQIEDEMKSAEATESFKKKATYVIADLRAQIAQLNKSSATAASTAAAEFTKEWVSKNLTGLKQIEDERAKSLAQLNEKAKKSFGTNYEQKDDYNAELDELNKYYDKKVSLYKQDLEEKVKAVNDLNYQTRGLELSEEQAAVAKVFEEKRKSIEELNSLAKAAYGDEFQTETDYIRQKTALEDYYAHELAKSKKDLEDTAHSRRLSHIQEENQKALEAAASRLTGKGGIEISDAANYAEASAKISMQNTDLGNALNGGTFGGGVLIQFIKAITESLAAIQSVNDVLNFAKTVTESLFAVISPILDSWLKPLADLLRDIGTEIGTVLAPVLNSVTLILVPLNTSLKLLSSVLQIVGAAFEWLNNKVIVPFGNIVIDIINALLGVINLIPGVNIAKLNKLSLVGDAAEELADEMTAATDRIKKKYQRMEDQVNDLLRSQISSLQSQYELGLITRDEYNAQAEKYNSSADEEILSIEKEMAEALKAIEGNTATIPEGVSSAGSFFSTLGSNIASAASSAWQGIKNTATTIGSGIAKVAGAAWNGVKNAASSVWNWVAGLFGHADGSTGIEFDHIARVHQGEAIIPKTFAQGIRNGEMSLVGGRSTTQSSSRNISVYLTVQGSVVTEKQLVQTVYQGIAKGIQDGSCQPLTA